MKLFSLLLLAASAHALQIRITGGSVSDAMRSHATSKLMKPLERHAELLRPDDIELHLNVQSLGKHDQEHVGKEAHVAEVTAYCVDKHTIHCEASSDDMYSSVDNLSEMLARGLRKYKEKRVDKIQGRRRDSKQGLVESAIGEEGSDEE